MCPSSVEAFQGGLGTVCEAIDGVVTASESDTLSRRAFVVIRPPGHHCGEVGTLPFTFVPALADNTMSRIHQAVSVSLTVSQSVLLTVITARIHVSDSANSSYQLILITTSHVS